MENYLDKYGFNYREISILEIISITVSDFLNYGSRKQKSNRYENDRSIFTDKRIILVDDQWVFSSMIDLHYNVSYIFRVRDNFTKSQTENQEKGSIVVRFKNSDTSFYANITPAKNETFESYEKRLSTCPIKVIQSFVGYQKEVLSIESMQLSHISISNDIIYTKEKIEKTRFFVVEEPLSFMRPYLEDFVVGDVYSTNPGSLKLYQVKSLNIEWKRDMNFFNVNPSNNYKYSVLVPYQYVVKSHDLYRFNESINESHLLPFAKKASDTISVFWRQDAEASTYIVEFYIYNPRDYLHSLYLMKRELIEKETGYSSMPYAVPGKYVIRVIAEDRLGKIIAKSRGISVSPDVDIAYCQDWTDNIVQDIIYLI